MSRNMSIPIHWHSTLTYSQHFGTGLSPGQGRRESNALGDQGQHQFPTNPIFSVGGGGGQGANTSHASVMCVESYKAYNS